MTREIECDVYKSLRKENYYIYVCAGEGLEQVPDVLIEQLGQLEKALSFTLTETRPLAKENPVQVMANLEEKGYHLQLPPAEDRVLKGAGSDE